MHIRRLFGFLRELVPLSALRAYHFALAFLAHLYYRTPSREMYVIGVTGTKGKTTTANLIADVLNAVGIKTGLTSSVVFRVGERAWVNDLKQGMPGRFALQKLLRQMADEGCTHAVVETTSEGMLQHRHRFIDYRMTVFTNLSPEHIERHGGFEKYRETKAGLFRMVAHKNDGAGVYNLDDPNVEYFLKPGIARRAGYTLGKPRVQDPESGLNSSVEIKNITLGTNGSEFDVADVHFEMPLVGEFNVYNAAAAIAAVQELGVSLEQCAEALKSPTRVSGRFEVIKAVFSPLRPGKDDNNGFVVIVDYAHEPKSLEEAYRTAELFKLQGTVRQPAGEVRGAKLICLLGSQGGGRDKWKRSDMGKVAGKYCDEIILTNEDPYDEVPFDIINDIAGGISHISNPTRQPAARTPNVWKIIDRKEAIRKAISLAEPGDVVILTGKGGEVWMCVENGRKIPWNDAGIVREILKEA